MKALPRRSGRPRRRPPRNNAGIAQNCVRPNVAFLRAVSPLPFRGERAASPTLTKNFKKRCKNLQGDEMTGEAEIQVSRLLDERGLSAFQIKMLAVDDPDRDHRRL